MKKKYKGLITLIIILAITAIIYFSSNKQQEEISETLAKCIGEKSILYVQLGCSHCKVQEEMFGSQIKYLNVIDCFYFPEKCEGITATPTWVINEEKYIGKKSIEELKELTGC